MFNKLFSFRFTLGVCLLMIVEEFKQWLFDTYNYFIHLSRVLLYEALHWMLIKVLL